MKVIDEPFLHLPPYVDFRAPEQKDPFDREDLPNNVLQFGHMGKIWEDDNQTQSA